MYLTCTADWPTLIPAHWDMDIASVSSPTSWMLKGCFGGFVCFSRSPLKSIHLEKIRKIQGLGEHWKTTTSRHLFTHFTFILLMNIKQKILGSKPSLIKRNPVECVRFSWRVIWVLLCAQCCIWWLGAKLKPISRLYGWSVDLQYSLWPPAAKAV